MGTNLECDPSAPLSVLIAEHPSLLDVSFLRGLKKMEAGLSKFMQVTRSLGDGGILQIRKTPVALASNLSLGLCFELSFGGQWWLDFGVLKGGHPPNHEI